MLIASGGTIIGGGSMRSTFAITPRFAVHVVRRDKVVFDTRFVPASDGSSQHVTLFALKAGSFLFDAPDVVRFDAPLVLLVREDQFEGAEGRRPLQFRTVGDPFFAVDLRFHERDLRIDPSPTPRVVDVGPQGWSAIDALAEQGGEDSAAVTEAVRGYLSALAVRGLIDPSLSEDATQPQRFARLWTALEPMIERYNALTTLQEVASVAGLSLRQVARDLRDFLGVFHFFGSSWRDVTVRARLKMATLSLSAPGATVAEVAKAAGYGSSEAMARAFRDAGLPPPSAVQSAHARTQ